MCGIAGIISSQPDQRFEKRLQRMQAALRHRGPDDEGLWMGGRREGGFVGFAHTRLSILDLTAAGHQPMQTPDGRFTITFNGEIYNFAELRRSLESDGVAFHSHSDTEVILRLYERDGPACVKKLAGMFAFVIWDRREESCFLARDPLGIKPLYYASLGGKLLFASELRAVLAADLVPRRLDPVGLAGYFLTGSVPEPATLIEGVRLLKAGEYLSWKGGQCQITPYYQFRFASEKMDSAAAAATVRQSVLESVNRHFVSDVPVGIFLSGGIDSTAILAAAALSRQEKIRTYSISFDDPALDESQAARRSAQLFGAHHTELRMDAAVGRGLFDCFLQCVDQPSIDGLNTLSVSKLAGGEGAKVVLSGLGGDELFGGYPSFTQVPRLFRWSSRLDSFRPLKQLAGGFLEHRTEHARWRRLGAFLERPSSLNAAYEAFRSVFTRNEAAKLVRHFLPGADDRAEAVDLDPVIPQEGQADAVSRLEITRYMRNQLLRDSDTMSMAWGLELRVPLVDRVLLDTVATIPAGLRLQPGKRLLAEALPELPPWVINQPKRGFVFPFERWLRTDWEQSLDTKINWPVRSSNWYQKWSLFVLQRWCELHRVEIDPAVKG